MPKEVTSAIHHREIRPPWTDRVAILLGHDARRLRDVAEVVRHPRGQQLAERDRSKLWMLALESQLSVRETPAGKCDDIPGAQPREFRQQIRQRFSLALPELRKAVIRREPAVRALGEDDLRAGNPVRLLAVDQM